MITCLLALLLPSRANFRRQNREIFEAENDPSHVKTTSNGAYETKLQYANKDIIHRDYNENESDECLGLDLGQTNWEPPNLRAGGPRQLTCDYNPNW